MLIVLWLPAWSFAVHVKDIWPNGAQDGPNCTMVVAPLYVVTLPLSKELTGSQVIVGGTPESSHAARVKSTDPPTRPLASTVTLVGPDNTGGVVSGGGPVPPPDPPTVRVVLPLTRPGVALRLLVPGATPWARPVVAPMVATAGVAEAQATEPVRTAVVASE